MANELRITNSLAYSKSGINMSRYITQSVTISGTPSLHNVQNIGTGDETLDLGDVATNGYILLVNLDATNYITMGADGSSYPIKLKAGESGCFRWNGAAIHAKANTSACNLEYVLISD